MNNSQSVLIIHMYLDFLEYLYLDTLKGVQYANIRKASENCIWA